MAMNVNFKVSGSGAKTFSLDLEPDLTVEEVKCLAMESCGLEPAQMKIIFKGRILKDTETVGGVHVAAGSTMHIVKSGPSAASTAPTQAQTETPVATPAAAPADTPAQAVASPSPGMPADLGGMLADPAMMHAGMEMMGDMGGGMSGAGAPLGGMFGMEGMLRDPQAMQQMLQSPMVQQMMQNISQNPQMLQAMMQNNPMIQQMTQNNPMLQQMVQQMLSNPQLLQTMMNPQVMQSMMQMQGMAGTGAPGAVSQTPATAGAPALATPGASPDTMFNPVMMQQMMQAMQGSMGGGVNGAGGVPPATDGRPLEERYVLQVQQLENMGFPDKHSNIQALSQTNGDVNEAINALLGGA